MSAPIFSDDANALRPQAASPGAIWIIAILWLAFACGLPFYQLREARRQAHRELIHILMADRSNTEGVIATFDRSNQNLDTAASGPCLILALTSIVLVNQLLKLKRRYNALVTPLR